MKTAIINEICFTENGNRGLRIVELPANKVDKEGNYDPIDIIFTNDYFEGECQNSIVISIEYKE